MRRGPGFSCDLSRQITKQFLIDNYINKMLNCSEISRKFYCNPGTIYYYLRKYGISIRPKSEIMRESYKDNVEAKRKLSIVMTAARKDPVREVIRRKRIKRSVKNLWKDPEYYQKMLDVRRRQWTPEVIKRSCAWYKNGKSKEPYPADWTGTLKCIIKERDNYTCQVCGKKLKRMLHIHHIDYDKNNLNPKNLISLCGSCHSKTNINRDQWQKVFNKIERTLSGKEF